MPATATFGGQDVVIRVQVNEASVSATAAEEDPEQNVSIWRRNREQSPFDLADVGRSIAAIADVVTDAVRRVAPDEAEVEFGIDVGVEPGQLTALLVKGSANATLNVRLLWKKGPAEPTSPPPAAAPAER